MLKADEKSRENRNLPRRVLARVVADDLRRVRGGEVDQPLSIVQTGGGPRDLSDTDSEFMY
jgi:hypothetical protein